MAFKRKRKSWGKEWNFSGGPTSILNWHIKPRLFKTLYWTNLSIMGDFRLFISFHIRKKAAMCIYGRRSWIIEFEILKRLKIDFTQFNWQTDSLIEIDNVVNGEKIDSKSEKKSWKWNIHAVLLVRRCLPGVNRRNFVTRWNFICKLLATMFSGKFRGQKKSMRTFFVIPSKYRKRKYLIKFFLCHMN